ncbi:MAG: excinuclease ABC subunit UvrB [Candidatus Omnitrophota bacterium]
MNSFKLVSKFKPAGDQPQAIQELVKRLNKSERYSTLLGVTGSGKTFTLACALEKVNRPALIISHNKTLAGQLYAEFKDFFPRNSVEYFVSYYDYYQPESYIPQTDTYIEKDASINERLDRLRLSTTSSLMSRPDVIVVASVSCIYNLGAPQDYRNLILYIKKRENTAINDLLKHFVTLQYERNNFNFKRGSFRVQGDIVDIFPSYREQPLRIEFFGNTIEKIYEFNPLNGKKIIEFEKIGIYPAKHFIIKEDKIDKAIQTIKAELKDRINFFKEQGKVLEAQRLKQRTLYDLEMLKECGYCHGIENYSCHLSSRPAGTRPYCLMDYFPSNFITVIDESHVTIPQVRGMYAGDKARKQTLINYGFRLPSCLDNRPLKFNEFEKLTNQVVHISATPADFEINLSKGKIIEQIIRPTGLPDPQIIVKPVKNQIDDLIAEIKKRAKKNQRVLVTTLTKRMSEELTQYLKQEGLKVTYIHSDINTLERAKILKDLRMKKIDTLVGINLLREGLDLPEVSLVAILDADKEGFLRSAASLIQVSGRCARNIDGEVYMYADKVTKSMSKAIGESLRRRKIQLEHNLKYKIIPKTIEKVIKEGIEIYHKQEDNLRARLGLNEKNMELHETAARLEKEMYIAAKNLHFEKAAELRDKVKELRKILKFEIRISKSETN